VVHGDLYARHLLIDRHGRLCGVLDWGDVHAGDPAIDLSVMFSFLPPRSRAELESAYGPIDPRSRRMARLRAAFHAVSTTWFAQTVGDADLVRSGLDALRFVVED
jgi:aminoglycoside phosphotransferase (APT) family kinase protein